MSWTSISSGVENGISDKEFSELMNYADIDLNFVHKRAEEHFTYLVNLKQKFAIVSIDMQPTFLRNVGNLFGKKIKILFEYHKKLKQLCKLNSVEFIEIEYKGRGDNVLFDEDSIRFDKTISGVNNRNFFRHLTYNKIKNLFMIGIFRNACVLNSINLCYKKHNDEGIRQFNIFTSLIGVGSYDGHIVNAKKISNSEYSLKYFFQQLKILKVQVLDYDESRLGWRL